MNNKLKYNISIYETGIDNQSRFTLGTSGKKPLFVIGLNPSTADDKKPDRTISKVMGFASLHDFDSFIMFNLYPQRTPDTNKLHTTFDNQLHNKNIEHILTTLNKFNDISILAAWSEKIIVRSYFKKCLKDIYEKTQNKKINWLKIGELTVSGHPRHPSRAAYCDFTNFDINKYLMKLK